MTVGGRVHDFASQMAAVPGISQEQAEQMGAMFRAELQRAYDTGTAVRAVRLGVDTSRLGSHLGTNRAERRRTKRHRGKGVTR